MHKRLTCNVARELFSLRIGHLLSFKYLLCLMTLSLLGACGAFEGVQTGNYPQRIYAPATSGQLIRAGEPVSGVKVVMSLVDGEDDLCYFSTVQASSNKDGRFELSAITPDLAGSRAGELDLKWQICVEEGEQGRRAIWYNSNYGALLSSNSTRLLCNLDKKAEPVCVRALE